MRSSSLNLRRPSQCLAAAAALLLAVAARADGESHKLMLTGYSDVAAGASLMAGDYAGVIQQLGAYGPLYAEHRVEADANLCIAYIMTRAWQAAHTACDRAVAGAKLEALTATFYAKHTADEQVALAYSNRAVIRRLESDTEGAASDLSKARELAPHADFVSHNLTAFTVTKNAQVEMPGVAVR